MKVLCTSYKDSVTLHFMMKWDCWNLQSESSIPNKLEEGTTHIVIDNDSTGKAYGKSIQEKFGVKIITPKHKDIFEDFKIMGTEEFKEHYLNQV